MTAASVALWTLLAGPSRPARILAIDAGTVYLQVDSLAAADSRDGRDHPGAVVALLEPDAVQLPIGIVLPPSAADLMPVSVAGSPVSRGEITIGWGAISLADVRWPVLRWWNPGIPALPLPARSITSEVGPPERRSSSQDSSLSLEPDQALGLDPALGVDPDLELAPGLAALIAGEVDAAVRQLIGVGTGLVPAGDHVLGGALAALAAWAPDAPARQLLATAVAGALERTSPASAALLQSAAAGFAVPELTRYLTALSAGGPEVDSALVELTALSADAGRGATTSGSAMALGVVHQLRALFAAGARSAA